MAEDVQKKYYWLRLKSDFFIGKEMKKLRKLAGGAVYTIIYLKMQLLSIITGGIITYAGTEDNLSEQLALELDEEADDVKLTLSFLSANRMIEQISEEDYLLNRVPELIGSETTAAERMRKLRKERNNVTPLLQDVPDCYTEIEKEIELDKEIDKERDKGDSPPTPSAPYQEILSIYSETCKSYPKVTKLSDSRRKAIKARLSSGYTLEDFKTLFEKAEASSFLKGANSRNWQANFDWLIKDANMAKVLDGNYDDKGGNHDSHRGHNSTEPPPGGDERNRIRFGYVAGTDVE